jgi:hypothetical protein
MDRNLTKFNIYRQDFFTRIMDFAQRENKNGRFFHVTMCNSGFLCKFAALIQCDKI